MLNHSLISSPTSSYNEFKSFDNRVAVPSLGMGPGPTSSPVLELQDKAVPLCQKDHPRSYTPESTLESPENVKKKFRLQRLKAA